ncbi:outer membrane beta-barrel protein [Halomonas sp. H10-59]|uniref:Outer membrane beta-barrel protein n=1 Tax=Halomonas sp. H10-59 TaxID=2950874 RepID=A0AAU7KQ26_9GAMM
MRHPLITTALVAAIAGSALISSQAFAAYGKGDIYTRIGVAKVKPDSDNGSLLGGDMDTDVHDDNGFAFTLGYRFHDKFGVELLAAEPFEHDVDLSTAEGDIGASVEHLPPTLTVQYYPFGGTEARVQPYVGLGVNYTHFSDEDIALDGADLDLEESWGWAGQAGLDLVIDDHWAANMAVWYLDIDSDVDLNGEDIGEIEVDPYVIMAGISYRF